MNNKISFKAELKVATQLKKRSELKGKDQNRFSKLCRKFRSNTKNINITMKLENYDKDTATFSLIDEKEKVLFKNDIKYQVTKNIFNEYDKLINCLKELISQYETKKARRIYNEEIVNLLKGHNNIGANKDEIEQLLEQIKAIKE